MAKQNEKGSEGEISRATQRKTFLMEKEEEARMIGVLPGHWELDFLTNNQEEAYKKLHNAAKTAIMPVFIQLIDDADQSIKKILKECK